MSEDYLWDRSGEPDPEIVKLEKLLAPFRHSREPRQRHRRNYRWLAIAAVAVLAIVAGFTFHASQRSGVKTAWETVITVNGRAVAEPASLYTGQRLRTGSTSRIQLRSEFVGQIDLEPNSELSVKESSNQHHLLSLRRGTLHALIWAPPSQFAVETPAARAIDLGCAYTLRTDARGDGMLSVERGWVAFEHNDRESFIPSEASCRIHPRSGPGIPWFDDAAPDFRAALERYEASSAKTDLQDVLVKARPRDAITLWHLLSRVPVADRGIVFDRFASLVKLPQAVRRDAVLGGKPRDLDLCWEALNLGETAWWRTWKQAW